MATNEVKRQDTTWAEALKAERNAKKGVWVQNLNGDVEFIPDSLTGRERERKLAELQGFRK